MMSPLLARLSRESISRLEWWGGILLLLAGLLAHAAWPRYQWVRVDSDPTALIRVDHWRGIAEAGRLRADWGRWVSVTEARATQRSFADDLAQVEREAQGGR